MLAVTLKAQAMLATEEVAQWRAAEILARSFAEYTSIVAGGALFSFGHIAGVAVECHAALPVCRSRSSAAHACMRVTNRA